MSALVELKNVNHKIGNKYLLHDINWTIEEGQNWLIFGLNGSGKTTLLSILAGYLSPSSGEVRVFGETYTRENIYSLRRSVGWISNAFFDKYFNNESVLQIVLSALTGTFNINEEIGAEDVREAKYLLSTLGLESKMNLPFRNLSKGERQNVLIARALICRPKILILDEPGAGLDILNREYMQNIIEGLALKKLVTVLYVTHYPSEIKTYMDHTLLLRRGTILGKGATEDVFNEKNISRMFQQQVAIYRGENGMLSFDIKTDLQLLEWYMKKDGYSDGI